MLKKLSIKAINFYQKKLSHKILPGCCGFFPTCSQYTKESIERFGFLRGGWIGMKRIFRCNPLNQNKGYDPVPEKDENGKPMKVKIVKTNKKTCSNNQCDDLIIDLNAQININNLERERKEISKKK